MDKTIIAEGRTTNEAIENGLKQLRVSKDKVEMTLKEEKTEKKEVKTKKIIELSEEEQEKAEKNVKTFMEEIIKELPENTTYAIHKDKTGLNVEISNENLGFLIGYRGETLYAFQSILSAIAGKDIDKKVRVILDIEGYKAKREKTLEELAEKVAKTVIRTRKPVKLEPMQAYERKIIHSKLQQNNKVQTESIGEEPNRRIVISLKKTR